MASTVDEKYWFDNSFVCVYVNTIDVSTFWWLPDYLDAMLMLIYVTLEACTTMQPHVFFKIPKKSADWSGTESPLCGKIQL